MPTKVMARELAPALTSREPIAPEQDASTAALVAEYRRM